MRDDSNQWGDYICPSLLHTGVGRSSCTNTTVQRGSLGRPKGCVQPTDWSHPLIHLDYYSTYGAQKDIRNWGHLWHLDWRSEVGRMKTQLLQDLAEVLKEGSGSSSVVSSLLSQPSLAIIKFLGRSQVDWGIGWLAIQESALGCVWGVCGMCGCVCGCV